MYFKKNVKNSAIFIVNLLINPTCYKLTIYTQAQPLSRSLSPYMLYVDMEQL